MFQLHCVHEGTRVHDVYSRRAQAAVESCWMASTPAAHSAVASLLVGTTATSRLTFRVLGHLILVCAFSFSGRSICYLPCVALSMCRQAGYRAKIKESVRAQRHNE